MYLRDLAIVVAICLIWGMNAIVSKIVVSELGVPPLFYGALRCVLITLAVFPWLYPMPQPRLRLVAASFLIGGGSFGIYFVGLRDATASSAAIVSQVGLPITTFLSIVMLGETIRWRRALGMALTLGGTILVIWDPAGLALSKGLLFVVLSSASGSLGAILMKQIKGVRPLQFQAWAGLSAVVPLALASALLESGQMAKAWSGGWTFIACLAFSALVVSVVAHTAYYWLIRRYEANLVAPLMLLTPVFTIGFGVALLGDRLDLRMVGGAVITLIGVLIIALRRNRVMPRALLVRERL
ncbi:MAG: DMT family transporter [Hyphomicrobiales bacterium]